jgi:hypothetical protein
MRFVFSLILFVLCASAIQVPAAETQSDTVLVAESEPVAASTPAAGRPVLDLEQLRLLELDRGAFNWRQDWWKYLLMASLFLLCLCLVVYLTKLLFWLFGVLVCLGSALAAGLLLSGLFRPWLPPLLPGALTAFLPAEFICHLLAGCLGYALAACVLTLISKPLRRKTKKG